jgi:DNA-binding SARP family transcriptional activator
VPTTTSGGVTWRILGPVEAVRDSRVLPLGPPRRRAVLAVLLARPGEHVPLAAIVDAVWPDRAPASAANVVHRHVGALRRIVEPGLARRAQGRWLLSEPGGYRIVVDEADLDLVRFRRLSAEADATTDLARRFDMCCEALDLWRGEVAADVAADVETGLPAVARERTAVAVQAADDALDLGRPQRVMPALLRAAAADPADERLHAAVMRCLGAAGRRAEALVLFEDLRRLLDEQLGVSPGPDLAAAHLELLGTGDGTPARRPRHTAEHGMALLGEAAEPRAGFQRAVVEELHRLGPVRA